MLELAADLLAAIDRDGRIAVATVVRQTGSAPRSIGTSMAVDAAGAVIGSISGGCVEGAAYETCAGVLASGVAARTDYGYSDDDAFAVGLSCGGRLDVVTTLLTAELLAAEPRLRQALEAAAAGRPAAVDLVTDTGAPSNSSPLGRVLPSAEPVPGERSRLADVRCDGEPVTALRIVAATPPVLLVYGAVDFGAALAAHAQLLGYRVLVVDARPLFATGARLPAGVEAVVEWPDEHLARIAADPDLVNERTAIAVLTHSDRFDVPLLQLALQLPVAYVGAMGSRATDARRRRLLRDAGVTDAALARLRSPIGLDLGGATPHEAAISILAELIGTRTGRVTSRRAEPLVHTAGSIHPD